MLDEYLIYRRDDPERPDFLGTVIAMNAREYGRWYEKATKSERNKYPVIARGLTETQARTMVALTEEQEDE